MSVRPAQTWDVVFRPYPDIPAMNACSENINADIPFAGCVFVFFASKNDPIAFITSILLARRADGGPAKYGWVVIAVAVSAQVSLTMLISTP